MMTLLRIGNSDRLSIYFLKLDGLKFDYFGKEKKIDASCYSGVDLFKMFMSSSLVVLLI